MNHKVHFYQFESNLLRCFTIATETKLPSSILPHLTRLLSISIWKRRSLMEILLSSSANDLTRRWLSFAVRSQLRLYHSRSRLSIDFSLSGFSRSYSSPFRLQLKRLAPSQHVDNIFSANVFLFCAFLAATKMYKTFFFARTSQRKRDRETLWFNEKKQNSPKCAARKACNWIKFEYRNEEMCIWDYMRNAQKKRLLFEEAFDHAYQTHEFQIEV